MDTQHIFSSYEQIRRPMPALIRYTRERLYNIRRSKALTRPSTHILDTLSLDRLLRYRGRRADRKVQRTITIVHRRGLISEHSICMSIILVDLQRELVF